MEREAAALISSIRTKSTKLNVSSDFLCAPFHHADVHMLVSVVAENGGQSIPNCGKRIQLNNPDVDAHKIRDKEAKLALFLYSSYIHRLDK